MSADLQYFWNEQIVVQAGPLAARLALAIVALLVVLVSARLALGAERRALARTRAHPNARLLVDRLIEFGFIVLAAVWVLSILGVQVTGLVALLGVVGLAVSLALQDVLKNLVAGLYILIERPFTIGEQIDFKTFSGVVETIELRTTALRTATGQRVIIPNAMLFADALVNRSVYGRQLVKLRVALPLPDERRAAELARQVACAIQDLGTATARDGGGPTVLVEALGKDKLTLRAEFWAPDARTVAPEAVWAVHRLLPEAEITVLES
jgi:small-conductance mechanosensitive channel